jgi:hypothetical protein
MHDKSSFVHSLENGSNIVIEYFTSNSLVTEIISNLVSRYRTSYASKLAFDTAANSHFTCPKNANCRKLLS